MSTEIFYRHTNHSNKMVSYLFYIFNGVVYVCEHIYACLHTRMFACVHVHVCVCVCVCVCVSHNPLLTKP